MHSGEAADESDESSGTNGGIQMSSLLSPLKGLSPAVLPLEMLMVSDGSLSLCI